VDKKNEGGKFPATYESDSTPFTHGDSDGLSICMELTQYNIPGYTCYSWKDDANENDK
jgi:hypothetical protein